MHTLTWIETRCARKIHTGEKKRWLFEKKSYLKINRRPLAGCLCDAIAELSSSLSSLQEVRTLPAFPQTLQQQNNCKIKASPLGNQCHQLEQLSGIQQPQKNINTAFYPSTSLSQITFIIITGS